MVVRLVRAGVGALLLLIAVPLALAGGGLLLAMEHRADDDSFTARLERVRAGGTAVVVPDVDALLRAEAPFARGGRTTLSLSAVGSGGPLFIGLGPEADVRRYLDGRAHSRVTRVRLARGPLPVELRAEPMARTANQSATTDAATADAATADAATVGDAAVNPDAANPDAVAPAEPKRPAAERFWIARSEQRAGAARLTWSPSALRGRHLSLVVMRADGTAGIDAAITARLTPAWLGPTTGGLLMLGGALFFLALITLAWPPARTLAPAEPLVIPARRESDEARSEPDEAKSEEPAVEEEDPAAVEEEEPAAVKAEEAEKAAVKEEEAEMAEPEPEAPKATPHERVMATLADVMAAADAERQTQDAAGAGTPERPDPRAECELDRPAPRDADLDDHGPIVLPPLPAMPNIELQFTWAPIAASEDTADSGTAAR